MAEIFPDFEGLMFGFGKGLVSEINPTVHDSNPDILSSAPIHQFHDLVWVNQLSHRYHG